MDTVYICAAAAANDGDGDSGCDTVLTMAVTLRCWVMTAVTDYVNFDFRPRITAT